MAINISLYQISEDERAFPKSLGAPTATHQITLKGGCSIDSPVVSFSAGSAIMATLNYAYIDAFARYYFIRDRKMTVNGVCELTLESDVLQSFAAEIKALPATITRTENERKADAYLLDNKYIAKAYKQIVTKDFPNELTDYSFILMTVG